MATTPKYDNDTVTLGYLNKVLSTESEETEEKLNEIPKNYNSPPVPPYYVNSLLLLNGQIYKCIKSRLVGSFDMSDWQIVVSTIEIDDALKTIYDVNKLEYVEQDDGIIETFYQSADPSLQWETDVEKNNHVSDLWTEDLLTFYQYTKNDTNPVTYSWKKRTVPSTLFDVIDGHKTIYLEEPSNYSKDDLWFGEVTKIAIASSTEYVAEHWENRDDFVESSVITQEEHTMYLLPKITEINRQSVSEIKKAIDAITLTVSQTYSTKTELENYKGEVAQTYVTENELVGQLEVTSSQIAGIVGDYETLNGQLQRVNETIVSQSESAVEMLFRRSGIQESLNAVLGALNDEGGINDKLTTINEYIRFDGAKITLGKSNSPSKLVIENDIIKFMTGDNISAYISENQLYITDSTILNKLQVGYWETKPDSQGNLNTRWIGV